MARSLSLALLLAAFGCGDSHDIEDGGISDDAAVMDDAAAADAATSDGGEPECPADLTEAIGQSCSMEGQFCGGEACTDECSFCNIIECSDGEWSRVEVFPAPCFDCGDDRCPVDTEYCVVTQPGTPGPASYECTPAPDECDGPPTCECVPLTGGGSCSVGDEGGVTVERALP